MIQYIYKTENIIKVSPEDTLSAIMPYFTSSHDAAFVFDEKDYIGVVSPYYSLIKKSYPSNTKAKHCLIHPPKVDMKTPIQKVARLMMESKIHYLPVFEATKFAGIISARRILSNIVDHPSLRMKLGDFAARRKPLITVFESDFISKAMPLFKNNKISKLIVIGEDFKLHGVLSYYDLITFLTAPKERAGFSRKGDNTPLLQTKVKNFMKSNVLTLSSQNSLRDGVRLILEQQIGSVIIVDKEHHPIGIVTTKDILQAYVGQPQIFKIDVVTRDLPQKGLGLVSNLLQYINNGLIQKHKIDKAKLVVRGKRGAGVFEAILSMFQKGGYPRVIKKQGKNLQKVLKDVRETSSRLTQK